MCYIDRGLQKLFDNMWLHLMVLDIHAGRFSLRAAGTMVVRFDGSAGGRHLRLCPSHTIPLRQTSCRYLRRSRPQEILDVWQRIRLRFPPAALHLPALTRLGKSTDNIQEESFVRRCDRFAAMRLGCVTEEAQERRTSGGENTMSVGLIECPKIARQIISSGPTRRITSVSP